MRWPKRKDDTTTPASKPALPATRSHGTDEPLGSAFETRIVARDSQGNAIATVSFDLAALQVQAETEASGTGDPVRLLADAIVKGLAETGVKIHTDARRTLEATLSKAMLAGRWPATMEVKSDGSHAKMLSSRGSKSGSPPEAPAGFGQQSPSPIAPPNDRGASGLGTPPDLFEKHLHYPLDNARSIYDSLVGLDQVKSRLVKEAIVLTQPDRLRQWSRDHHGSAGVRALEAIHYGTPLLIFAGDVGTGKSALAESFGDAVAREISQRVSLLRMSIQTRGSGIVGDMTRQISRAFRAVEAEARRTKQITILLLDEADALAESRETQQMHHEDRAGVNALIQGLDHLRGAGVPGLVVFCSNRLNSIDPAVRRRAVDIVEFRRPDEGQRRAHLDRLLGDLGLTDGELGILVELTGARQGRAYGFTYSDIADRFVRNAVLSAFPNEPLSFPLLKGVAESTVPTRPFGDAEA